MTNKATRKTDNEPESVAHTKPETFMMVQELKRIKQSYLTAHQAQIAKHLKDKYRKEIGLNTKPL